MQSILDIKLKMETQAKQEFAQAKLVLDAEEEKLAELFLKKRFYEERAKELLQGKLDLLEIAANKEAIIKFEEYIEEQKADFLIVEEDDLELEGYQLVYSPGEIDYINGGRKIEIFLYAKEKWYINWIMKYKTTR